MKILITPPLGLGGQMSGGVYRTLQIYSRIGTLLCVQLCVDEETLKEAETDPEILQLLQKFKIIKGTRIDKGKSLLGALRVIRGFLRCLREARESDIILGASEQFYSVVYSYLISILSKKPLILTIQLIDWDSVNNKKKVWIYKRAISRAIKILCLDSEEVLQTVKRLAPDKRILPIINGIETKKYYSTEEKEFDAVFIGAYEERKGIKYLYQIWDLVKSNIGDAKIVVLGKGWENARLEKDWIYPGFVSENKKRELLARSKLMIFPSLYESFGLVVAEALASSVPVVLWDLPWTKRWSKGVIKVPFGDVQRYANTVINLLKDVELRKKLANEGREFAETLSWDRAAQKELRALLS